MLFNVWCIWYGVILGFSLLGVGVESRPCSSQISGHPIHQTIFQQRFAPHPPLTHTFGSCSHCWCIFFLLLCSMDIHDMLILILICIEYLQNVVFSIEKSLFVRFPPCDEKIPPANSCLGKSPIFLPLTAIFSLERTQQNLLRD